MYKPRYIIMKSQALRMKRRSKNFQGIEQFPIKEQGLN